MDIYDSFLGNDFEFSDFLFYTDIQKRAWWRRFGNIKEVKKVGDAKMTGNLVQDWPVYVLLGAVIFFFIFVIIKGNLADKSNKEGQSKEKSKVQNKTWGGGDKDETRRYKENGKISES